jgi:hypothetical protein
MPNVEPPRITISSATSPIKMPRGAGWRILCELQRYFDPLGDQRGVLPNCTCANFYLDHRCEPGVIFHPSPQLTR